MEMLGAWFLGIIRGLFAAIDKVVVWLIESLYDLIFQISSVQVFDNASLAAFANRITVILSIFMIFKLSLSFLNYIVNPDAMTDKSKGFSKLIQNIAVALVLLVSYQFLFDKAMELQQKIVDNNTIPKLIIGSVGKNVKNSSTISFPLFSAFVVPNNDILYSTSTDTNLTGCRSYSRYIEGSKPSATCDLKGAGYTDNVATDNSTVGTDANSQMDYIVEHQDTNALLDFLLRIKKGDKFAFDYKFIISTICGAFAALVLLSFCMDVAVRIIKLYFLRLIAPIPIISYIDPIKGEGIFKKWLSNVGKTYADLFIRLIAIFFAIFIIQQVATQPALKDFNGNPIDNPFVIIFIIIGALMFAKQFPKLIQDITGISLDGKMQLNPFKKIGEQAVGGKLAGKTVGAMSGLAGGTLAGLKAGKEAGAPVRGALLGGLGGLRHGFKEPKGSFGKSMNQEYKNLTGNEWNRFTPSGFIMSHGKKAKENVKEPREALKTAYANRRHYESELNIAQQKSIDADKNLRALGIDTSSANLSEIKRNAVDNAGTLASNISNTRAAYEKAKNEYAKFENQAKRINSKLEKLKNDLSDYRPVYKEELVYDQSTGKTSLVKTETTESVQNRKKIERNIAAYENLNKNNDERLKSINLNSYETELNKSQQEYDENQNLISEIEKLEKAKKEESEVRDIISSIDLNIKTIDSEKGQRDRFYHYDESPQEKYKEAVKKQAELQNKINNSETDSND